MSNNEKLDVDFKKYKYVWVAIFILITSVVVYGIVTRFQVMERGMYTVGKITDIHSSRSGVIVYITYSVNGKEYSQFFNPGSDFEMRRGRNIYIKFLPDQPERCEYLNITVPECALKGQATPVWKKIPDCE